MVSFFSPLRCRWMCLLWFQRWVSASSGYYNSNNDRHTVVKGWKNCLTLLLQFAYDYRSARIFLFCTLERFRSVKYFSGVHVTRRLWSGLWQHSRKLQLFLWKGISTAVEREVLYRWETWEVLINNHNRLKYITRIHIALSTNKNDDPIKTSVPVF